MFVLRNSLILGDFELGFLDLEILGGVDDYLLLSAFLVAHFLHLVLKDFHLRNILVFEVAFTEILLDHHAGL